VETIGFNKGIERRRRRRRRREEGYDILKYFVASG